MNRNKETISIALAADNNYVVPLGITIFSILYNKGSDYDIDFFILESHIDEKEKEKINKMVYSYGCTASFISIDEFLKNKNLPENGYLRKVVYARMFIPKLVDREKIIYLDTDIVVNGELTDLFNQESNSPFLALKEPDTEKIIQKKNDPSLKKYFNSGVLVINCKKWKELKITERALEFAEKFPEKIEYADQDALNYTCQNLWEEFDRKYNYEVVYNEPNTSKDSVVTHYIGDIKPWHYEYPNKTDNYSEYAQMSPWKDNWQTKPTIEKRKKKIWMKFKLVLKTIPGLKKVVVRIKQAL